MDFLTVIIVAALFAVASIAVWLAWRSSDESLRAILAVYCAAYLTTTFLGALLIGLLGFDRNLLLDYGLDTSVLPESPTATYWLLLFGPFIVPCGIVAFANQSKARRNTQAPRYSSQTRLHPASLMAVFGLLTAFCCWQLISHGYGSVLTRALEYRSDYFALIVMRTEMMNTLHWSFFSIVYTGLPALSFCALHEAVVRRSFVWKLQFLVMAGIVCYFSLSTVQKLLVLIYVLMVGVGLLNLGVIRKKTFTLVLVGVAMILFSLQLIFLPEWSWKQTVELVVYRTACAFPYYVSIFPDVLAHGGIDFGLHFIKLCPPPRDNLDVFNIMYPDIRWVQGAVAVPAHVRAYSQAGTWFAMVTLALIGVLMIWLARINRRTPGPLSFALSLQTLTLAYYLTQVSVVDAFLSSYGLFNAVAVLAPLWLWQSWLSKASIHHRAISPRLPPAMLRPRREQRVTL